jgi:hypothetical protein
MSCHASWFSLGSGPNGSGLVEQVVRSNKVKKRRCGLFMASKAFHKLTYNI